MAPAVVGVDELAVRPCEVLLGEWSSPSETISRRKNSARVQSMTTLIFLFSVGIRDMWWYVRCMNQAGSPLSVMP